VFLPGSIVALLLAVAAALCVHAAALALDRLVRSVVDVRAVDALLLDRGSVADSASDLVDAQLTSAPCLDRVDLDVRRLTSLLHRHRANVEGFLCYALYRVGRKSKLLYCD